MMAEQDRNTMVESGEEAAPGNERPARTADQHDEHEDRVQLGDVESAPPERKKPGLFERKPWLKYAVIIVALVLVAGAILWWLHARKWEDTDDAQIDGHIATVSARISGHVTKINYDDNQTVDAGAVLCVIDPSDYQIALEKAQADYQDSRAQAGAARSSVPLAASNAQTQIAGASVDVTNAQAQLAAAKKQTDAARAQLVQAQANAVKANSDVARYAQLIQKQEIAQQQYDTAVAAAKSANAGVDAAHANMVAAEQQINVATGKVEQAKANLQNARVSPANVRVSEQRANASVAGASRAQASLDQAKLNLQYTQVIAPISGIVGRRSVEIGQNVDVGQMLMSVVPLNGLYITANFKETQLHYMRVGQYAKIHVDALGKDIDGRVDSIGAATGATFSMLPPENATGNYVKVVQRIPVKITYDRSQDPNHRLRPGMSVEADVKVR